MENDDDPGGEPLNLPEDRKDIPLFVKYETRPIWGAVKEHFGGDATVAVAVIAAYEASFTDRPVSFSRAKAYYEKRDNHQLLSYRRVVRAVDYLEAGGWIIQDKRPPGGRGWQSSMIATPELIEVVGQILSKAPRLKIARPAELIILRDENGNPLPLPKLREIYRMEKKIEVFNEVIGSSQILTPEGRDLSSPMVRIFNLTMMRNGRYIGMGVNWQNVKSEMRRTVKINGESVVELDFKTLHPAILYAEAGAPLPRDCYDIGGDWPRDLVKIALLTIINAKTEAAARLSIANSEHMAWLADRGTQKAIGLAHELIETLKKKHAPIAGAFHSDAGARLMRIDSDIAEAVMTLMMIKHGITVLPVHDSFLVQASKRDLLEEAMLKCAHEVAGLMSVRIEQK